MTRPENLSTTLESRKLIAETPGLCVQILTLSDRTDVPRQYHTEGTDTFACLEGPKVMKITYGEHVLETGNTSKSAVRAMANPDWFSAPLRSRRSRPALSPCVLTMWAA